MDRRIPTLLSGVSRRPLSSGRHAACPAPRYRRLLLSVGAALLVGTGGLAQALSIPVPNGDFSNTANFGTVGGGLLGGTGSGPIGTGPWNGAWFGALGLLAPPSLTVQAGSGSVGGLAGLNVLGLVNNGGSFQQVTSTPWQASKHYTLAADVTPSGLLDLSLLHQGNVGLALTDPSGRIASTATSGTVTLTPLGGSAYHLQLTYDTGATVNGNIGIHLFTEPNGLLTANLLGSVAFSNVTLSSRMINQVPTSLAAVDSSPRNGTVGAAVTPPLSIKVLDADGDGIPGVTVTFTVPSSGPSATVTPNPATTDANGVAQVTTTANTIAGSYQIIANVSGVVTPVVFNMTNQPGPTAGFGNVSGNAQSGVVAAPFAAPIGLQAVDQYGNGVPGVPVTYTAPASGASAGFPTANTTTVTTGADGRADVAPVANTIAGAYQISATTPGVATPQVFNMTNRAGPAASVGPASGSGQGAVVMTPFAQPLSAFVGDAYGNPVSGTSVTFVAPTSGASATGLGTVSTGADGLARITPTANGIAGVYTISAHATGVTAASSFTLTNLLDPSIVPDGSGEPSQNAAIEAVFSCQLLVQITNGTQPQANLEVDFVAPAAGPSAVLSHGSDSGSAVRVSTDSDGYAWVEATANDQEGSYTVGAQLLYSTAAPIEFQLRNLGANDPIFGYGFDGSCRPATPLKVDVGAQTQH